MTNDDRVRVGFREIAELIGKPLSTTSYLLLHNELPAFKVGRIWHMLPSRWRRFQEEMADLTLAKGEAVRKPRKDARKQPAPHILRQRRRVARSEPAEPAALSASAPLGK